MYRVEWTQSALSDLAYGWELADKALREEITIAAFEAEKRLQNRPDTVGESRDVGTRVLIVRPLSVTYHVNARTSIVLISTVQVYRRKT